MDCIDVEYRINLIQRSNFPVLDLPHDLIRDIRDKTLATLKSVDFTHLIRDLAGAESAAVHVDDLLVNRRNVLLTVLNNLRLEGAVTVFGNIKTEFSELASNLLRFSAVTAVVRVRTFRLLITEMVGHLGFHHRLDRVSEKVAESILDVLRRLQIELCDKIGDKLTLRICQRLGTIRVFLLRHKNFLLKNDVSFYHRRSRFSPWRIYRLFSTGSTHCRLSFYLSLSKRSATTRYA